MRKANIFKRILSCMLVLTLIMSGLGLDLGGVTKDNVNNVIDVEASAGDTTGDSVSGGSSGGNSARIKNVCYRISIISTKIIDPSKKGVDPDNIREYLSKQAKCSVIVTEELKNDRIYCLNNRGITSAGNVMGVGSRSEQAVASSLQDIWSDCPNTNTNLINADFTPDILTTSGNTYTTHTAWNNEYLGAQGPFQRWLQEGNTKVKAVDTFKDYVKRKVGIEISIPSDESLIVFEPVVISYGTKIGNYNDLYALSWQDCIGGAQNGEKWSYAFTKLAYPSSTSPYSYLDVQNKQSKWASVLRAMRSVRFEFRDTNNAFGAGEGTLFKSGRDLDGNGHMDTSDVWDTGFGLYGVGVGNSSAKSAVNYTLFCDGSSNTGGIIKDVKASFNAVSKDNYDTINPNLTKSIQEEIIDNDGNTKDIESYDSFDTLDSDAKKLATMTKENKVGKNEPTYKTGDVATLTYRLTGITSSSWTNYENSYIGVASGVKKICYNNNDDRKTENLIKKLTSSENGEVISILKNMQLVSTYKDVGYSDAINLGKTYSLQLSDGNDIPTTVTNNIFLADYPNKKIFNATSGVKNTKIKTTITGGFGKKYNTLRNYTINGSLYAIKCAKDLESLNDETYDSEGGKKPSTLGVSVTVLAKKQKVNSFLALATLNRDDGSVTCESYTDVAGSTVSGDKSTTNDRTINKAIEYDVSEVGTITLPSSYSAKCFYVAVPNSDYSLSINGVGKRTGADVFNAFSGNQELSTLDEFKTIIESKISSNDLKFGEIACKDVVKVGCNAQAQGYSILVLQVKGNVLKKSNLELMDYELNYVYPSMITDGKYASLVTDISYKTTGYTTVGCMNQTSTLYEGSYNKFVKADVNNYKGNIINKNLGLGSNKNILRYDDYIGLDKKFGFTTEQSARQGNTFVNNLTDNNRLIRFSLAVNLIRSSFDDNRVISSITKQTSDVAGGIDETYARDNLELTFANKPNTQAPASELRNSNATVGNLLEDMFEWNVEFTHTDCSPYRSDLKANLAYCGGHPTEGGGTYYCAPVTWYEIIKTQVLASDFGSKVKYKVSEKAFKYQTASLDTGKNDTKTVDDSLQKPTNGKGSNSSLVSPYKIAVVHSSNSELSFYPEVEMRAYSSIGDTITNDNMSSGSGTNRSAGGYVTPHNLLTMGEVIRKVKPSAMYVIRVNHKYDSGSEVNPAIKGTTISDSTAVGTNADAVSDGKPVIYAGGDVTVKVNPDFRLNMYGYSLDLIETSDNNLADGGNYASVVNDNSNIKSTWGNTYTSTDIKKEFDDWAKDILTKHLGVDMTLTVNGSGVNKEFNNFTSSLGNMDTSASTADGVYSIKVKEGTIVKDWVGYQKLLSQIKSDYELSSETDAEKIFTNSDIWQSIERAVEDSNDSFNNSQKSDAIDDSRAHWYDEEVKTFVIRRYKKENLEIKNVVVNDKIDYGAAPTADDTTASLDSYKGADAKWYMTLYLKKDGAKKTPDGFSDSTVYYNPSHHDGLSGANDTGSVLINEVYVDGADFVIPSASTYDMGN